MIEACKLIKENFITKKDLDYIFDNTTAGAECDSSFLCFEDVYFAVRKSVPKDFTVIDIGCAYAFQSFLFSDYKAYIGVDLDDSGKVACNLSNGMHIKEEGKKYLTEHFNEFNKEKTIVVCSWNPSFSKEDNWKFITDHFKYYICVYGNELHSSLPKDNVYFPELTVDDELER